MLLQFLFSITHMMSSIQSKIIRHIKRKENMIHCQERKQPIMAGTEQAEILQLSDGDFKVSLINMTKAEGCLGASVG